jgi:Ala-tRNA(Pro) deacylase
MSIPKSIREYLDSREVWYQYCTHSLAYTAQGVAHAQHISGKEMAKVVIVVAGGRKVMTVVPGHHRIDLGELGKLLGAEDVRLATEEEFKGDFADCEVGAMPPFGNLYQLEVLVDESLASHADITFNAGTHIETIQMHYADYEKLVSPKKGSFSTVKR